MQKDKNKKKTLTISGSFNKKLGSSTYKNPAKKSFSVDTRKNFKAAPKFDKLSGKPTSATRGTAGTCAC